VKTVTQNLRSTGTDTSTPVAI